MRFAYRLPVFGGWLRNVEDQGMEASWRFSRLARRSEELGFDLTLVAELNLNDISRLRCWESRLLAWITSATGGSLSTSFPLGGRWRRTSTAYLSTGTASVMPEPPRGWLVVSLEDYSVSNRGLRSGLIGSPDQIPERIVEFEPAGVDLLLLQFTPQLEEMERFAEEVMPLVRSAAAAPV